MRKIHVVAMVLLMAAVLALPAVAQSAMWVGGELGANWIGDNDIKLKGAGGNTLKFKGVQFDTSVIGGITVGYDFVNTGFGGYNYPDWMKYFGFAVDYTFNRANLKPQAVNASLNGGPGVTANFPIGDANAWVSALTFLFYGHYGFLPDSEVPAGRLHPYVGVGPAIVWTGLDAGSENAGSSTATNVALVAEGGVRFMALKNVSFDLGFRYRYYTPTWEFKNAGLTNKLETTINSYSILTRVAYHF